MDVPKDAIAVASVAQAPGAEVTSLGTMGTRQCDIDPRIRTRPSKAQHVVFVYAAGPGGSWLYRSLTRTGDAGWVVAPALRPKKSGDRVTTDRRAAVALARVMRSGELTPGYGPSVADAALGELSRAREDPLSDCKAAKCRRNACWLRHDIRYTGRAPWHPAPLRGLSEVVCATPAPQSVFHDYGRAVNEHPERLQRLAHALQAQVPSWRFQPVVEALQALRGVPCTVAVPTVAALGALPRFAHPRERMQVLGLMPSAYSPGARRRPGSRTKAGHTPARRALMAGAGAYRSPAQVRRPRPRRLENQPKVLQAISWKAHVRLCTRYRRLIARGNHATQVVVAIARELMGCMGASAQPMPVTPSGHQTERARTTNADGCPTCIGRDAAPVGCTPRRRSEPPRASSCRERGRHLTEARQGVPTPRRAAGSTVAYCWLRLC
jgi:transposase